MDFRVCTLGEMMSSDVIKIRSDQSIDEALHLMRHNRIRHLPVIDNETMVGFLSLRDLMNAKLDYANKKAEFLKDQLLNIDKPLPM
jgi:CBS domain-containing protein